ncbi:PadR family transcriptional regulator [Natrarchaeobaculum aegyptiacum]|uniref:PadR family transcriptional regulator n=1 Tax=Natrarchaeobaculum aegyptiacum TaxID=745377 RepID=A0A2Z2HTX0_9EURY|nr:PadR family transcriptional regulator [Natrarchaeobaculum aegyptiacum]ARS90612.1 PadR family transcriptional regulator [Natrarchaeobaculum aegyptiacum]
MRDDTIEPESVLEELSRAVRTDHTSESQDATLGRQHRSVEDVDRDLERLLGFVTDALPVEQVAFEDALVKGNLEEVLLVLIAMHEEAHGDQLLTDLERLFDARLSPGTVYPCLHDLEDEDVLSMHAKVRTKEYSIDDREAVRETVETTMLQHLSFGLLLYAFLEQYE